MHTIHKLFCRQRAAIHGPSALQPRFLETTIPFSLRISDPHLVSLYLFFASFPAASNWSLDNAMYFFPQLLDNNHLVGHAHHKQTTTVEETCVYCQMLGPIPTRVLTELVHSRMRAWRPGPERSVRARTYAVFTISVTSPGHDSPN